ncbi:hypothetical protein GCM10007981_12000 [Thermocladium modestius]|uniref:Uncharacterized protein n=1 Tax=Thermocladium modestius TaxID=62609 RepID=A0A830GUU0_9CREN|nr:hypothetical protein GCM10007981_12000 [Thermocladium modestius]
MTGPKRTNYISINSLDCSVKLRQWESPLFGREFNRGRLLYVTLNATPIVNYIWDGGKPYGARWLNLPASM